MSNLLNPGTIAYEPLPEPAKEAAFAGMRRCGFDSHRILENYSFSSTLNRNQAVNLNINAVAFTHSRSLNLSNAGMTLFNAVNGQSNDELVSLLAQSTAPFHIIHRGNQFTFLASTLDENNKKPRVINIQDNISYEQIGRVLSDSDYASDLKPERILEVKQGRNTFSHPLFRTVGPLQLSLWATDVNSGSLVNVFGNAVIQLRMGIEEHYGRISSNNREMKDTVTDLAIQLLGATILADTGVLEERLRRKGAETPLDELLGAAATQFPNYFTPDLFEKYEASSEMAYQLLRQIHYSGFLPEMLRGLYLQAYSKEDRKKSGSFDTPLYLTRHIWKHIPVEYLPPRQRITTDITCGWGSFLIAGYERLSQLSDMKHLSLRNYLRGNDRYHLTARLAGLGLLLTTSEDHWHIDDKDALKWNWLEEHQPNIIVGNPPFRAPRARYKDEQPSLTEVETDQENAKTETDKSEFANRFLKRALEHLAPGGFLAMVMPRSFTVSNENPTQQLRKQLLEQCDIQELLELPSGVFQDANPRALVIFAQKKTSQAPSHFPVRIRTVQSGIIKQFQSTGIVTTSSLVSDQSLWKDTTYEAGRSHNTNVMEYKLILPERKWDQIKSRCVTLDTFGYVFRGAITGTNRRNWGNLLPKEVPWLANANSISRSFHITYDDPPQTKLYPHSFERARFNDRHIFEGEKVLFVRSTDTSWGRRSKVAIEREGYYVSGSFLIISPHTHDTIWSLTDPRQTFITNEVLAAVIYWYVGNAWIIEHTTSLGIPEYALKRLPFPDSLTEEDCTKLTTAIRDLENDISPLEATKRIDAILQRAYGLDDKTLEYLREITRWDSRTSTTYDSQPDLLKADCYISGCVESVNAPANIIRLWIKGMVGTQRVQITPAMPGWLLRPGIEFYTKVPRKYVEQERIDPTNIDWNAFHPQMYTYMNDIEIMQDFAKLVDKNFRGDNGRTVR